MSSAIESTTRWQEWHAARERDLAGPHGWLTLTSFHWLPERPTALPGLPGRFWVADGRAMFEGSAADGVRILDTDGTPGAGVTGSTSAEVAEARSLYWLALGDVVVELMLRGGRYAIRTRDPRAPGRVQFRGVPSFDVDDRWVVDGSFQAFDAPRRIQVSTARDDLVQFLTAVGSVTLEIDGQPFTLLATAGAAGTLNVAFSDATSGKSTAPWRSVGTTVPDEHGRVRVDFNRAVNFPFAFSDYGTCPAPPEGNNLPLAVPAGEKAPERKAS
jgi:uncharacterized protein (DUF1684 family)